MKNYVKPNAEVVYFTVEEILTTSAPDVEYIGPGMSQEAAEMYEEYTTAGGQMTDAVLFRW